MTPRFAQLRAIFPLIAFSCAVGNVDPASASCGDYLYKPGKAKKDEMAAPMEPHEDSECKEHRHNPSPIAPTTHPRQPNDQLIQARHLQSDSTHRALSVLIEADSGLRAGHRDRVDRPPQR